MTKKCAHCGSIVPRTVHLGGEVEWTCPICSREYISPREIRDREGYLARLEMAGRPARTPVWKEAS